MSLILSGTDGLSDVDGSAATPAIRGTDANTGIFFPAADTIAFAEGGAEVARFDSSGNFGLGVTPSAWRSTFKALQILGTATLSSNANTTVYLGSNWYNNTSNQDVYTVTGAAGIYAISAGVHAWYNAPSGTAGSVATFTQAMTLDASGNLGIGTSSPVSILDVNAKGTGTTPNAVKTYTSYMQGSTIGTNAGELTGWGVRYGTISATPVWFGAKFLKNGVNAASDFTIWTSPDGDVTTLAERVTVTASGNLLVGTTGATNKRLAVSLGSSTSNTVIYAESGTSYTGGHFVSVSATAAGTGWYHFVGQSSGPTNNILIYGNGNIQNANNSYGPISDIKVKENITDATPKLEKLMQVRVVNYNLKGELGYETHTQIGVIAQELEQVFPGLVHETPDQDKDGNDLGTTTKGVKMSVFVPMLIKAMQEQQALITQLTARITALESA